MRTLVTIIVYMTLTLASTARAQETVTTSLIDTCENKVAYLEEQVTMCEQVVTAGNKYIKSLNVQLDQKTELATALERELALTKERAANLTPAWYERPSFVVPMTILATAATITLIRKAARD